MFLVIKKEGIKIQKNLLLGNGINMHLNVKDLSASDIARRFEEDLIKESPFYELLFGVSFTPKVCRDLFSTCDKIGIESLAQQVYSYVIANTSNEKTVNFKIRLIDTIICTALSAIFYEKASKIGEEYNIYRLPNVGAFDQIFTLNYMEFWDKSNQCIYLHGCYDNHLVAENGKDILLYSYERYQGYEDYDKLVHKLRTQYNLYPLYTRGIVFSPEFSKKDEMITLGQYPSEDLYPNDDLFLHEVKELYVELDNVKQIEIFGVSPYGDSSLIDKINRMDYATVYIYDKDNNKEATDWDKVLTCPHVIKDSTEIMKL